jgi:hypothetical protein
MRTVIHTTVTNPVPVHGQGHVVTVQVVDARAYRLLRLRLDERHPLRASATQKAEKFRLWPASAGAIRPLELCSGKRMAGSSCRRPMRPCRSRRLGL